MDDPRPVDQRGDHRLGRVQVLAASWQAVAGFEERRLANQLARVLMGELDPDGIGAVRAYFDRFWNRALASFKDIVEQQERNAR